MDVYFQTDYKVREFKEKYNWQKVLARVIKDQDKITARMKKVKDRETRAIVTFTDVSEAESQLLKEAKNLGIQV